MSLLEVRYKKNKSSKYIINIWTARGEEGIQNLESSVCGAVAVIQSYNSLRYIDLCIIVNWLVVLESLDGMMCGWTLDPTPHPISAFIIELLQIQDSIFKYLGP